MPNVDLSSLTGQIKAFTVEKVLTALLMLLGQMGILLNISRSANVEKT